MFPLTRHGGSVPEDPQGRLDKACTVYEPSSLKQQGFISAIQQVVRIVEFNLIPAPFIQEHTQI